MLYAAIVFQILFMVLAPIAFGRALVRRGFGAWKLFFMGALAFVASQIVHIPLLVGLTVMGKQSWFPHPSDAWKLPVNALLGGLLAGACEEPDTAASNRSCSACSPPSVPWRWSCSGRWGRSGSA